MKMWMTDIMMLFYGALLVTLWIKLNQEDN